MLHALTDAELEAIAPIAEDGSISVCGEAALRVLADRLDVPLDCNAITQLDYCADGKHPLTGASRTVKGIAWRHLDTADRAHVWSFRTDDLDLSTTDEGKGGVTS